MKFIFGVSHAFIRLSSGKFSNRYPGGRRLSISGVFVQCLNASLGNMFKFTITLKNPSFNPVSEILRPPVILNITALLCIRLIRTMQLKLELKWSF